MAKSDSSVDLPDEVSPASTILPASPGRTVWLPSTVPRTLQMEKGCERAYLQRA